MRGSERLGSTVRLESGIVYYRGNAGVSIVRPGRHRRRSENLQWWKDQVV